MLANANLFDIGIVLVYLFLTAYLGWKGYQDTKNASDYLVAGRKAHPFIMALSYGATFISTSAIVGFGGVAAMFGMSLLWLTFANIFIGIFIAFIFLGEPTRHIGHRLDAHTFPELLGRRFQSKFIQVFSGLIIAAFMPLYGAAVLIGGTEFIVTALSIDYNAALLAFAAIVAAYVFFGGIKGVMYTDALQGTIMLVGMLILIVFTYVHIGGVIPGHKTLTDLADLAPSTLTSIGHRGWTAMPEFGFGNAKYNLWWVIMSTIVLGVGIGVLAQPQLVVRFMTVRSKRELNRAVGLGAFFILSMVGVAYTTGALSNAYFSQHGALFQGRVIKTVNKEGTHVILQVMKQSEGVWKDEIKLTGKDGKPQGTVLAAAQPGPVAKTVDESGVVREGVVVPVVLDRVQPRLNETIVQGRSISIVYAKGVSDQIIPTYISAAMPKWFGVVFLLTLLAAAMSTLSSQFHTLGTAVGRDVVSQLFKQDASAPDRTVLIVRIAILLGLLLAVVIGYYAKQGQVMVSIIARATAIFFGLCAATFMPAFIGGLFWKRMTRVGAIASMLAGLVSSAAWLALAKMPECQVIGLVKKSILADSPNWPVVDALLVALPISALVAVVVSLMTTPPDAQHLDHCFSKAQPQLKK